MLFLHGVLGAPGNFEAPIRMLIDAHIPVLAPCYGRRATVPVEESLAELRGLLTPLGPVDIVGHSLGAALGLRLAQDFPVRTLVGLGAAFRGIPYRGPDWLRRAAGVVAGPSLAQLLCAEPWPVEVPAGTRVVSIHSTIDRVVPASSSELGEVIALPGIRHEHLPQVTHPVLAALGRGPGPASAAG